MTSSSGDSCGPRRLPCISLVLVALCAWPAHAAGRPPEIHIPISNCLQPLEAGGVADWGEMVFEALGVSTRTESAPAVTATLEARRDALRNLKAAAGAIRVDASRSVADLAGADEVLSADLERLAKEGQIVAERQARSGHTESVAAGLIWGGERSLGCLVAGSLARLARPSGAPAPAPETQSAPSAVRLSPLRWLVIDARLLEVAPALFPRIADEESQQLFQGIVPPDALLGVPFFTYAREVPEARPGEALFMLSAVRAEGNPPCDLVVESGPVRSWLEQSGIAADVLNFRGVVIVY